MMQRLLDADVDFVLFETDAVWFDCAFRELHTAAETTADGDDTVDIWGLRDGDRAVSMGFGFLLVRANERTRDFWRELTKRFSASIRALHDRDGRDVAKVVSEQQILNDLFNEHFSQ